MPHWLHCRSYCTYIHKTVLIKIFIYLLLAIGPCVRMHCCSDWLSVNVLHRIFIILVFRCVPINLCSDERLISQLSSSLVSLYLWKETLQKNVPPFFSSFFYSTNECLSIEALDEFEKNAYFEKTMYIK